MMKSLFDRVLLKLDKFLGQYAAIIRSVSSGFLLGRFTNEVNDQNKTIVEAFSGTFDSSVRANNILSWIALGLILLLPRAGRHVSKLNRRRQYSAVFGEILEEYRSQTLKDFNGLAWGETLSLQTAPNIFQGWSHAEIHFDHRDHYFRFQDAELAQYESFCTYSRERLRLWDDGSKIRLTSNPVAFVDSPTLRLSTQLCKYSENKFKEDVLLREPDWRSRHIREALDGPITFPHSLCLHAVVVTADDKVLLTKRSHKVSYYPGHWSCSLEEQITLEDLRGQEPTILAWTRRMLREELGLQPHEVNADNIRVMSVFLETDIMNVSLCGHVSLDMESGELDKRLRLLPRQDNEFSLWQFMTHEELAKEIRFPMYKHHGSTGYRIMFALIKRYGNPTALERILRQDHAAA